MSKLDIEQLKSDIINTVIHPTMNRYLDLINEIKKTKSFEELSNVMDSFFNNPDGSSKAVEDIKNKY